MCGLHGTSNHHTQCYWRANLTNVLTIGHGVVILGASLPIDNITSALELILILRSEICLPGYSNAVNLYFPHFNLHIAHLLLTKSVTLNTVTSHPAYLNNFKLDEISTFSTPFFCVRTTRPRVETSWNLDELSDIQVFVSACGCNSYKYPVWLYMYI